MKKQFRDFKSAREFTKKLGLKNNVEWREYCKSGNKPTDIPVNPNRIYKNEFKGYGDWLGTGNLWKKQFLSFEEAREFVRKLGLKSRTAWDIYCKSGKLPGNIPKYPNETYEREWEGVGNWLGTGTIASQNMEYRSFEEAREFVRKLGLKSRTAWDIYCKSGNKPTDIPVNPVQTYEREWEGVGNWLGTGTISNSKKSKLFLSPKDAKPVLKKLFKENNIKNLSDWQQFAKTHGKLLEELNLPSQLLRTYSKENANRKIKK